MHLHGLLPLVKTFCLRRGSTDYRGVSPKLFNCCTLRRFSALSNVQELDLEDLDIPKFMPRIRRYFGHFVPTVRTLILKEPRGSRRQIIYFIGLFQNLQNLALYDDAFYGGRKEDLTLVPPSIPPLQGWLTIKSFARADLLLKDMIDLFGGIRFSQLWLYNTGGMQRLLSACAKTLRTVVLSPTDTYSEQLPLKGVQVLTNDFAAIPSLQDLSLSQNKSLREIHIPASSITSQDTTFSFLKHVLSTVAPLRFLKIVVLYWDCDLRPYSQMSQAEINQEASRHHERFALLREVHKVRDFRLTLSASVSGALGEYPAQILERAVAEEKAKNGFDEIFPVPSVLYYPIRP